MAKVFAVVEFDEEGSVAVVPSSWLVGEGKVRSPGWGMQYNVEIISFFYIPFSVQD